MTALVIGGAGFVGRYLIDALVRNNYKTIATTLNGVSLSPHDGAEARILDITDRAATETLLHDVHPDVIFHLAAQSSVRLSWEKPGLTTEVNAVGAANIFESVRKACPEARVLVVGSAEEYGNIDYSLPVTESAEANPRNVYALTKLFQERLAKLYCDAYGMNFVMTRSFNHFGPYQDKQFVVADFCSQVAAIEKGLQEPVIRVGNLAARRDFTDVRDVVDAYLLLAEKGERGQIYNVGSGKCLSIREILDAILSLSTATIDVVVDEKKFRPIDVPEITADIAKLHRIGWKPKISVQDTIADTLEYYRANTL